MRFNGPDYEPENDQARLSQQHVRIRELMRDGAWRTLGEIEAVTKDPQASISAQLRHLRKPRFGSWIVLKRRRGDRKRGLYEYRLAGQQVDADEGFDSGFDLDAAEVQDG